MSLLSAAFSSSASPTWKASPHSCAAACSDQSCGAPQRTSPSVEVDGVNSMPSTAVGVADGEACGEAVGLATALAVGAGGESAGDATADGVGAKVGDAAPGAVDV